MARVAHTLGNASIKDARGTSAASELAANNEPLRTLNGLRSILPTSPRGHTTSMPGKIAPDFERHQRPEHPSGRSPQSSLTPKWRKQGRTISEDEKRLLPNFNIPADAIHLPDPRDGVVMPPKPGSHLRYAPVDTLDATTVSRSLHQSPRTYGKPPMTKQRRPWNIDDVDEQLVQTHPRHHQAKPGYIDDPSPGKRRKLRHLSPPSHEVIDLADGEDVPDLPRYPFGSSDIANEELEQPRQHSRNAESKKDSHYTEPLFRGLLSSPPSTTKKRSSSDSEDELQKSIMPKLQTSKRSQKDKSHYFEDGYKDLRSFRRAPESDRKDELADNTSTTSGRDRITSTVKNNASNQCRSRKGEPELSITWPLLSARGPDFDESGDDLRLSCSGDKTTFQRLISLGKVTDLRGLDLCKFNLAQSDSTSKIRLQGSHNVAGQLNWCHLEFKMPRHCRQFCNDHVARNMRNGKVAPQTPAQMHIIFNKDLDRQKRYLDTLQHPTPAQTASPKLANALVDNAKSEKTGSLIDGLKKQAGSQLLQQTKLVSSKDNTNATRHGPKRSTRANLSLWDVQDAEGPETPPLKYSEEHGLGQRWAESVKYTGRRRALVAFDDLLRLDEGECLNDALVDFYMIYLFEQAKVPANKVYFFNPYFYDALTKNTGRNRKETINYDAVARWTRKEDLFSYDYIVVPVCEDYHWYLAIICNVSNIPRKLVPLHNDEENPLPEIVSNSALAPTTATAEQPDVDKQKDQDGRAVDTLGSRDVSQSRSETPIFRDHVESVSSDPILFEQDRSSRAASAALETSAKNEIVSEGSSTSTNGTMRMQKLSLDETALARKATSLPTGIIGEAPSPSPKKVNAKRKSGPPLKQFDQHEPVIVVLDSLGSTHPKAVRALREWIVQEGRQKRGMEVVIQKNTFYVRDQHIPMQPNQVDCGVYVLGYLQKFFMDPGLFISRILSREMNREEDWPDMSAPDIRHAMRRILQGLAEEQGVIKEPKQKKSKGTIVNKPVAEKSATTKPTFARDCEVPANERPERRQAKLGSPFQERPPNKPEPKSRIIEAPQQAPQHVQITQPTSMSPRKRSPEVQLARTESPLIRASPKRPFNHMAVGDVVESRGHRDVSPAKKRKTDRVAASSLQPRSRSPGEQRRGAKQKEGKVLVSSSADERGSKGLSAPEVPPTPTRKLRSRGEIATDPISIEDSQETAVEVPRGAVSSPPSVEAKVSIVPPPGTKKKLDDHTARAERKAGRKPHYDVEDIYIVSREPTDSSKTSSAPNEESKDEASVTEEEEWNGFDDDDDIPKVMDEPQLALPVEDVALPAGLGISGASHQLQSSNSVIIE